MRNPRRRSEWKAVTALGLLAVALLLWCVGLVVRPAEPGEGIYPRDEAPLDRSPAAASLDLLAEIVPPPGARGCGRWRELARLSPPLAESSGLLGFDAIRVVFERRDDDILWRIAVLLDGGGETPEAVALRLECRPRNDAGRAQALALAGRWPRRVEPLAARDEPRDSWLVRWRDPVAAAELESRARSVLGGHVPVSVLDGLRDDYELLIDPLRPVQFQPSGLEEAAQNDGRRALERLLTAGHDELVRNLLRGLDPEARVFAMEALLERVRPSPEDAAAMRVLLELQTPVRATNALAGRARASDLLGLVAEVASLPDEG